MHHRHHQTGGKFGSNANDFEKVNEEKSEAGTGGGEGSLKKKEEEVSRKEEGGRSQEQSPKRITILLLAGNDTIGCGDFLPV